MNAPGAHSHDFLPDTGQAERNTFRVIALTAVMMVVEIVAGIAYGSMALLADGWHMSTHVAAFAITAFAYRYARRHSRSERFTFGTGKVGTLGGWTSAVALAVVALVMAVESIQRLLEPHPIAFDQAMIVAGIGLAVNLVSALLLQQGGHHHHHEHGHGRHDHDHHHHGQPEDQNLRAAYLHVLADALTSVTAIVALVAGKFLGWSWLDAAMGVVGAIVITIWAKGLLTQTGRVLLDADVAPHAQGEIREALAKEEGLHLTDLHVWQVGPGKLAAIIALATRNPKSPEYYKSLLAEHEEFVHITVEVHHLPG